MTTGRQEVEKCSDINSRWNLSKSMNDSLEIYRQLQEQKKPMKTGLEKLIDVIDSPNSGKDVLYTS